jgi:hypothetical protein
MFLHGDACSENALAQRIGRSTGAPALCGAAGPCTKLLRIFFQARLKQSLDLPKKPQTACQPPYTVYNHSHRSSLIAEPSKWMN